MAKKKAKKKSAKKKSTKKSLRRTSAKRASKKDARRITKKKSAKRRSAKKRGGGGLRSKGGKVRAPKTWEVTIFSDGTADPDPLPDPLDPTQKVKPGDKIAWFAADPADDVRIDFDKPEGNPFDPSQKNHPANGNASNPIKRHAKRSRYCYSVYVNGVRYDPVIVIDP